MARTKEYIAIKNFFHNELGITSEEIKELAREAIREEAKSIAQNYFQRDKLQLDTLLDDGLRREAVGVIRGTDYKYKTASSSLWQKVAKEITSKLEINLKK